MSLKNVPESLLYSKEEIRNIVLTNIIKMITARSELNENELEKNIKNITNQSPTDNVYNVKLLNNNNLLIKIINQKINGVGKQTEQFDFINKNANSNKIIICSSYTDSARDDIYNYPRTEIFKEVDMMHNLLDNVYMAMKYEWINKNDENYDTFFKEYNCSPSKIPRIPFYDKIVRYYNKNKLDIVKITFASETSGLVNFYKIVV